METLEDDSETRSKLCLMSRKRVGWCQKDHSVVVQLDEIVGINSRPRILCGTCRHPYTRLPAVSLKLAAGIMRGHTANKSCELISVAPTLQCIDWDRSIVGIDLPAQ